MRAPDCCHSPTGPACHRRQDPYCRLELSGQVKQTKSKTDGGKNPAWNERFTFVNVSPSYNTELQVTVADHNALTNDTEVWLRRGAVGVGDQELRPSRAGRGLICVHQEEHLCLQHVPTPRSAVAASWRHIG